MVTYLNEYGVRTEVTEQSDIDLYYRIDAIMDKLSTEEFEKAYKIIGDYLWEGGVANTNRIRGLAKRLGVANWKELWVWACLED